MCILIGAHAWNITHSMTNTLSIDCFEVILRRCGSHPQTMFALASLSKHTMSIARSMRFAGVASLDVWCDCAMALGASFDLNKMMSMRGEPPIESSIRELNRLLDTRFQNVSFGVCICGVDSVTQFVGSISFAKRVRFNMGTPSLEDWERDVEKSWFLSMTGLQATPHDNLEEIVVSMFDDKVSLAYLVLLMGSMWSVLKTTHPDFYFRVRIGAGNEENTEEKLVLVPNNTQCLEIAPGGEVSTPETYPFSLDVMRILPKGLSIPYLRATAGNEYRFTFDPTRPLF